MAHAKYLVNNMQFSKLDEQTIRITETKPIITDYNVESLLDRKSEYERIINEIDGRIALATLNWKNEQADCLDKIKEIDSILSECEKLNIKVEEKLIIREEPLISEDTEVPVKI